MISHLQAVRTKRGIFAVNFIFSAHLALVNSFNAAFLVKRGVEEDMLGLVYTLGFGLSVIGLILVPTFMNKVGNYRVFVLAGIMTALSLLLLPFLPSLWLIVPFFAIASASFMIVYFSLDLFLEACMEGEGDTGSTRAIYLTLANIAFLILPSVGGLLLYNDNFANVYVVASFLGALTVGIGALVVHKIPDPKYNSPSLTKLIRHLARDINLRNVFIIQFLLRFFFGVMTVYMVVYFHQYLGIPFTEIGLLYTIMISAFVLLEYPLGKVSDKLWGEKELLIIGLIIIGTMTIVMASITVSTFAVWAAALFLSRVGAAMVDITSESYFFKHVDGSDIAEVGGFRLLYPLAYATGPLMGGLLLFFLPFQAIFVALGLVVFLGIPFAIQLEDTL